MSLTREQWVKMWENVKEIENIIKFSDGIPLTKRLRIINRIKPIKDDIQSVIGQME